jgi:hypothetical protein
VNGLAKCFFLIKKMSCKISQQTFLFWGFSIKTSFSRAFNDNMSVIHIFITKQLFSAAEKVPHFLAPPTVLCMGWGSSVSFQLEAVSLVMALKHWGLGLKLSSLLAAAPLLKAAIALNFLNLAGLPPLSGFFAKLLQAHRSLMLRESPLKLLILARGL